MEIKDLLKNVIDPELGINIVDLGLVYDVVSDSDNITVRMTLSTKGCPLGEVICLDVKHSIMNVYPDHKVNVELVWEPVWTPQMVSDEGKKLLGIY